MAKKSMVVKSERTAKFCGATAQPLQDMRSSSCLHPQVRHVPNLLPRTRQPWHVAGRCEI